MKWCFYILLFLGFVPAQAQVFQAEWENDSMRIGEHNTVYLQLTAHKDSLPSNFKFNNYKEEIISKVEVLNTSKPRSIELEKSDSIRKEIDIKVIVFDSGYYAIPPFEARWNDTIKKSNASILRVNTVEVDTSEAIKDIRPILHVKYTMKNRWDAMMRWLKNNWLTITISGVAAVIFTFLLIYLIKKHRNREEIVIKRPAHEIAFERLDRLDEKELLSQGKHKEFYSELTSILRKYLEERYDVRAMEQTTTQIKNAFKWVSISNEQKEEMITLLQIADWVKFAKGEAEQGDQSVARVRRFLVDTKADRNEKNEKEEST